MAETRLHLASQGFLSGVDQVEKGWLIFGILCVIIVFLVGYLITMRLQRLKTERLRQERLKKKPPPRKN
ncbi:MAG: hypothetical protein HQL57_07120 [Magnetococcales bacterium]|nr:hypothetical protein [Magnetococcales bacterium]MBF0156940.1 hypothetical protein [Magnetococcales bacterium]